MSDAWYAAGLDLGQASDYTALAILKIVAMGDLGDDGDELQDRLGRLETRTQRLLAGGDDLCAYELVALERFPLGMLYPDQVATVRQRLMTPELRGRTMLVLDSTGVGAPVLDLVRQAGLTTIGVQIHGGENVVSIDGGFRVPKRDLVTVVQVVLQQRRLKFAAGLPEVATLTQELANFHYKISASGHDSYAAWRENAHDDLVLALALAVWWCESSPVVMTQIVSARQAIGPRW